MRVAAIDVGTNTVLLLIAEKNGAGLQPVMERATITRLGEGVDRTRRLAPAAIERTRFCLLEYAGLLRAHRVDRLAVAGTSAMRDAEGGASFRAELSELLGCPVRVISGDEEAKLSFRGALSGLMLDPGAEVALFDIGGGSTEVVMGRWGAESVTIRWSRSVDVGSVRLTERHCRNDPPTEDEVVALRADCAAALEAAGVEPFVGTVVGVAGTVTSLAAVQFAVTPYDAERVHGSRLSREQVAETVSRLRALPVEDRRRVPGLDPKRADVIVAGGLLMLEVLDRLAAPSVVVSDRGVRWGLALELASEGAP